MLTPKTGDQLGPHRFWNVNFFCATGGDIGTTTARTPAALERVKDAIGKPKIINQVQNN